jgi:hypothetical protein
MESNTDPGNLSRLILSTFLYKNKKPACLVRGWTSFLRYSNAFQDFCNDVNTLLCASSDLQNSIHSFSFFFLYGLFVLILSLWTARPKDKQCQEKEIPNRGYLS